MYLKTFTALLVLSLASTTALAETAAPLPILRCTLEAPRNPHGDSPVRATGNLVLEDAIESDVYGPTGLGLIPAVGFTNFDIVGSVYAYQLSSGQLRLLLQIQQDDDVLATRIFDADGQEPLRLVQSVQGIPVTVSCEERVAR